MTGVEFTHMFKAPGCEVSLVVVWRQQVLPKKDPEVAAVLEDEFGRPECSRWKGAGERGGRAIVTP